MSGEDDGTIPFKRLRLGALCHAGHKLSRGPCTECGAKANETCGRVHLVLEAELAQLRSENKWLREELDKARNLPWGASFE